MTTQEILIGDVEIISMLMPCVAEGGEDLRGDAGVGLHARADDRDLAHLGVLGDRADADLGDDRVERRARVAQVRARDGEATCGLGALGRRARPG